MKSQPVNTKFDLLNITPITTSLLALSIGTLAIAFSGILIRLSENELGPTATIFNRFWIVTIIFSLWNQFSPYQNRVSEEELLPQALSHSTLLLAAGMLFPLSQISWAWSLSHTTVTLSTLLHNLTPLFTCLGGWLWLGQRYDWQFNLGMFLAIGGCVVIGWSDIHTATLRWQGDWTAVLSAILYAGYILVVKQLRATVKTMTILLWVSALGSLVSLPIVLLTENRLFPCSFQGWLIAIALAVVCQALGQGLIAYTLNRLSGGLVALSHLSEPVLTGILAWLILAEQLDWSTGIAFFLIMLGLYLGVTSFSAIDSTH